MKIHERLSKPSEWCQWTWARAEAGHGVLPTSPDAVRWSLAVAAMFCYEHDNVLLHEIMRKLNGQFPQHDNCEYWQDAAGRTFDEVRSLALRLDV